MAPLLLRPARRHGSHRPSARARRAWRTCAAAFAVTVFAIFPPGLGAQDEADARPRVLLLGDSISIGYTAFVTEALAAEAAVFRPRNAKGGAENCAGTTKGVEHIDRWLAADGGEWDVIHFNFGLHDLKRVQPDSGKNSNDPDHPRQAELEAYTAQLRAIVEKLEATGARLVFATTTPVPQGVRPFRENADVLRYNDAARALMRARGIAVNDLYAFARERQARIQRKADVHFSKEGSAELAEAVVEHIRRALSPPVRVFVLAGQSNMEGKARVSLLAHQLDQPGTRELFGHLHDGGEWVVRDDVWIKFFDRKGGLTVGYGSPDRIGPELQFGHVVGDHFADPVVIVKIAWGGRSLHRDFRPPSAGLPSTEALEGLLERVQDSRPGTTMADIEASFGASYRAMLSELHVALSDLGGHFPALGARRGQLAGFVWFQGWNDMIDPAATAEYTENLAHFIRDFRRAVGAPELPFVIGQLGVGGVEPSKPNPKRDRFKAAQAAVAELSEFRGNVAVVPTDVHWDVEAHAVFLEGWRDHQEEWETVGSDYPFHYLGSAKTMVRIGGAFADAMLALLGEA